MTAPVMAPMPAGDEPAAGRKKSGAARVLSVVSGIVIAVVLVAAVAALIVAICYRAQGETLTVGGMQYRIVLTGSMEGDREDSLRTRSIVGIQVAPADEAQRQEFFASLQVGDIITFNDWTRTGTQDDPVVNTHRIVEINETETGFTFTTQGDANDAPDAQPIGEDDVIGKVTWSNYGLGAFLYFLCSTTGIVVCLIVPAALILIYEIFNIARIVRADRHRKQQEESDAREREIERLRAELEELKRGEEK